MWPYIDLGDMYGCAAGLRWKDNKLCNTTPLAWRMPYYDDAEDLVIRIVAFHEDKASVGEETFAWCLQVGDVSLINNT